MRTATGIAVVAIGAIFAFAVTSSPSFINLQVTGWVLILAGVAGLLIPRRGYGWLRRRVVRRPRGAAVDTGGRRPALGMGGRMLRRRPRQGPGITLPESQLPVYERVSDNPAVYERVGDPQADEVVTDETSAAPAGPAEETVEEFFQE
jgi:Domain of unknown function (DUF6458)